MVRRVTGFAGLTNGPDFRYIRDALRMYLQPIKSDDSQLDFYTMYKRETMEYDTGYMDKYNEDLNTTLIFVFLYVTSYCLFSAVSPPSSLPSSRNSNRIPAAA